jgi:hypothetical protein
MLAVAALEIGDPITVGILVEAYNRARDAGVHVNEQAGVDFIP